MLREPAERYGRPPFAAETGTEGDARAGWFLHVCDEVHSAREGGVPVAGVCLYPIVNFPGWNDGRRCENGLRGDAVASGHRVPHAPLGAEFGRQRRRFEPHGARARRDRPAGTPGPLAPENGQSG